MTVLPAYGRDYTSKRAVLEDWNAGKDFMTHDIMIGFGHVANKQDTEAMAVTYVSVRSADKTKQWILTFNRKTGTWK